MKLQDIIIWVMFIISVFVALWYLFGNSPTLEEAILILIVTFLITNILDTREMKVRFGLMEGSFVRLIHDFREFKENVEKKLKI